MVQLRADAQRNLGLVLEAAAEVFAERGPDASVDEIARRAGVGHATVFRRFPTKEALLAAVVCRRLDELTAFAEDALAQQDAGEAFRSFVWHAAEMHARDRALYAGVGRCEGSADVGETKQRLESAVAELVRRAQEAGAVRRDSAAEDVPVLVASAIQPALASAEPARWRRYVDIVLNGLRPPD